jgi:DnaJ-class molecular chaperone
MAYTKKKNSTRLKCTRCNGIGKIIRISPSNKMSTYKKQNCPKCNGKGSFLKKL